MTKKLGRQTLKLQYPPTIAATAAVVGQKEGQGPLKRYFDYISYDSYFGEKTWEKAETAMLKQCFSLCCDKCKLSAEELDFVFSGDLLNQCVGSAFAMKDSNIPYFGLYGACSTMGEALTLGAMTIDGGFADTVCALTSSHFCSSERQYRFPLAYGGQRTPTAQWTATAAGAAVLGSEPVPNGAEPCDVRVTHVLFGKMVEMGVKDAANMGAAMAPEDVNLDPYIFRCAERCVLQKIRYYHNHSLVFPLERTETENRQSHLIPYLASSGILSAQMFFLSKHRR